MAAAPPLPKRIDHDWRWNMAERVAGAPVGVGMQSPDLKVQGFWIFRRPDGDGHARESVAGLQPPAVIGAEQVQRLRVNRQVAPSRAACPSQHALAAFAIKRTVVVSGDRQDMGSD